MKFYLFSLKYWNEYMPDDVDYQECHAFVAADGYADAMANIVNRFKGSIIMECNIREAINDGGFFFIEEEYLPMVLQMVNEYE